MAIHTDVHLLYMSHMNHMSGVMAWSANNAVDTLG